MNDAACIICAYDLDGDGGGTLLSPENVGERMEATSTLTWVHLDHSHPKTCAWLRKKAPYLDQLLIDALTAEETRPRVEEQKEGILVNLRGVNISENAQPEDMVSVRLWIDEYRIISLRRRPLGAVMDVRGAIEQGNGPATSGHFLSMLCNYLFGRIEPVLGDLSDATDDLEEVILEHPSIEKRKDIIEIRRQAIMFRRYMMPQRDVVGRLKQLEYPWLVQRDRRSLLESHDKVMRYIEDLDMVRERTQIIQDELMNALADRMNRNMYVLSVVAAIFLPLGFFTGLFGINVGGIPWAQDQYGFWFFLGSLVLVMIGTLVWVRKSRWLA